MPRTAAESEVLVIVGGAAVTEEFLPGFRNSVAAYSVSLLNRRVNADLSMRRELLALFTRSAGDYLDECFESEPIKAVYGFDSIVGNYASPYTPGSAYVLLHLMFGEVNGRKGAWGHAIGGMGAITQAMAAAARARGVAIHLATPVRELTVEAGRVTGARSVDGRAWRARCVVSNLNPRLLYERLVDPALLPVDFRERIGKRRCGSGTHPGGGVSGAPGYNAARAVLADRRRWWRAARH